MALLCPRLIGVVKVPWYLSSAYKPDKEVIPLKKEFGYICILDPILNKKYWVPNDQLVYRELDVNDLL